MNGNRKRFWILSSILVSAMLLTGCANERQAEEPPNEQQAAEPSDESSEPSSVTEEPQVETSESEEILYIRIEAGSQSIVFQLNDSSAARSLYDQLPLTLPVENYSNNEKIFYPPKELDVSDTPPAEGPAGTLAYYEPWGDVAMFYGECSGASGLYELGEAIAGSDQIENLAGEITIEKTLEDSGAVSESSSSVQTEQQLQFSIENMQSKANDISTEEIPPQQEAAEFDEENTEMKMNIQIGNSTFTAALEDNAAADAFASMMEETPVVIQMSDYSGFEKVGPLGTSLPASDSQTTTQAGDIVLYNGNQIVLFYGSNSWSYTRLGTVDDLSGWEEALGSGDVTVTFSIK